MQGSYALLPLVPTADGHYSEQARHLFVAQDNYVTRGRRDNSVGSVQWQCVAAV